MSYMVIAPDPDEPDQKAVSFYDGDEAFTHAMRDAKLAEGRLYAVRLVADFEKDGD